MKPAEIFLSHSSKDRDIAAALADTMQQHGIAVWYSETNIKSAAQWHDEIGKALKRCDWLMLLISKNSVDSKWVRMELRYALTHKQYDDHILPVRLDNTDYEALSWTLDQFQMIAWHTDPAIVAKAILGTWGIGLDNTKLNAQLYGPAVSTTP